MNAIAIIGAMPSELADIRKALSLTEKPLKISGFEFFDGEYKGKSVVICCCGIGKVNASLCTQVLIDNFNLECIINTGIAGGMNDAVKVCDVVISTEVLPHDLDPHFLNDYPPYCSAFRADQNLIEIAEKACEELSVNSFRGRIVSGEAFISSNEVKAEIQSRFNPYAVDMESAGVGQCCYLNDMPFVSVRCISDNADDDGAMSFDEFEKISAKRVADIVLKMTESIEPERIELE